LSALEAGVDALGQCPPVDTAEVGWIGVEHLCGRRHGHPPPSTLEDREVPVTSFA
jgi:hypothetical protein